GGSALAQRGLAGELPGWFVPRPGTADAWRARIDATARAGAWLDALEPAFGAAGRGPSRVREVAAAGGVVVTTGQQPGLFGGPLYTLAKALSALELADALQATTGRPVAPVFWAATDDADFVEASRVWARTASGATELVQHQVPTDGVPMAEVPLEGTEDALAALVEACGSSADSSLVRLVREAYSAGATVGGAYLAFLRGVLEPLGIAVLDASHPAVRAQSRGMLEQALRQAEGVNAALRAREGEILGAALQPQVGAMPELSLVFTRSQGRKVRVPVGDALSTAADAGSSLSPNVLLRPALERQLLPTVAYVAGPGEFAYFAQVTAVAAALGWELPLAVPRWSGTVLEPGVLRALARCRTTWRDLAVPHAAERTIAREASPPGSLDAIATMRATVSSAGSTMQAALTTAAAPVDPRVVEGTLRQLNWRIDRLERRLLAGVKRREADLMQDLARARGALFPGGMRQERALSFVPLLAVHGDALLAAMRAGARRHALALVAGHAPPADP
ncbi:MAG: bacillithiol biosynthesis BshC, partial [Gemmatimonadetes bacterium]|nr:bacillithiol biosynthesis BshC [Gemmatimonadota bacterium]